MAKRLKHIKSSYLKEYSTKAEINWNKTISIVKSNGEIPNDDFGFYITASSVFSSKIEGNSLDLNSFFRLKKEKTSFKSREIEEIDDLKKAYQFAIDNELTLSTFLKAHFYLSKTLVATPERGKFRKEDVGVYDSATGKPAYLAVESEFVKQEMEILFADISILIERKLNYKEIFYYASMIHLWTAMIHPFTDGNGRAARLLEKWFLAAKLGKAAWAINSEKFYWDNRPDYYKNIALGYNYYVLKWERCINFLLMLPKSVEK